MFRRNLSGWLSVRNLINLDTAIFAYKELINLHPEQADSPFNGQTVYTHKTRDLPVIIIYLSLGGKTQNFQKTMAFAGGKIWNKTPKKIRMAQTLHSFKEHLAAQQAQPSCLTGLLSLQRCGVLGGSRFV